jgi:DSF synthase
MINSKITDQILRTVKIQELFGQKNFTQIELEYSPATKTLWNFMKPRGIHCFNIDLLKEIRLNDEELETNGGLFLHNGELQPVDYYVVASKTPGVFNYGGDLALFSQLIKERNRSGLLEYAKLCVDCVYSRAVNYLSPLITISLVQGDALGGGFETALSSNVIIAEHSARMGLPEIIFNLFPGMGAYSFLARRVGPRIAEEMISSGNIYGAEELHAMGVVDILAEDGEGEQAVSDFIKQHGRRVNGLRAMYECRRHFNPLSYKEMMDITEIWVNAALKLSDKDIHIMNRIVRSQIRQNEMKADSHSSQHLASELIAA